MFETYSHSVVWRLLIDCISEHQTIPHRQKRQYLACDELHAARKRDFGRAVFADALVGGRDAADAAARVAEQLQV